MSDRADVVDPFERRGAFASFRHRDFSVFWTAALLSSIGTWMQTITVPYALDELTHSTAVVGIGVFFTYFPSVIAAPFGGSLADRYSRKHVLLWSQSTMMLVAFALWGLWTTHTATPVNLLACVTVSALAFGITQGAWFAFVTQLVPREDMLNAVRLNTMQQQGARAVGPGIAGVVLASFGAGVAFFANGVSFIIVLAALLIIPARAVVTSGPAEKVWAHLRDGLRYVGERRVLAISMLAFFVFTFCANAMVQLVEPFTRRVLHGDATQYGVLAGAYGVGAVLGSLVTVGTEHWRRSQLLMVGACVMAGTELAFGLAPSYAIALVAITLMGVAWVISQVSLQTTVQANVRESHRGRVMALYFTAGVGVPLGAVIGGAIGQLAGLRTVYVTAAVLLLGSTAYAVMRYHRLRLFDQTIEHTEHIRSEFR